MGGRLRYGYDVVKSFVGAGDFVRGGRTVNETEGEIVPRGFSFGQKIRFEPTSEEVFGRTNNESRRVVRIQGLAVFSMAIEKAMTPFRCTGRSSLRIFP